MMSQSAADSTLDTELIVEGSSHSKSVKNVMDSFDKSFVQLQHDSIPACTSVEGSCKTDSATKGYVVPTVAPELAAGGFYSLQQRGSIPACTSVEGSCKTDSATKGYVVPTVAPELAAGGFYSLQ